MNDQIKIKVPGDKYDAMIGMPKEGKTPDRKITLLKAAYDLLKKCDEVGYVRDALCTTIYYDGTDCDGACLMEDIKCELDCNGS